jgi:membrane protease YdiL (CAAX protease family)
MSESLVSLPEPPPSSAPPVGKGRPLLAWLVIAAVVGFILYRYAKVGALDRGRYDLVNMRMQGRLFVGLLELEKKLSPDAKGGAVLYEDARTTMNRGSYAQRLRFIALVGELMGPDEARVQLHQLNERYRAVVGDPSAEDTETARVLDRVLTVRKEDPAALASLPEDEQRELRQRLDWFGDLALAPADDGDEAARTAVLQPAYRTAWSMLAYLLTLLGLSGLGLILLATLFVLWMLGLLRGGLTFGSPHGGVYAETFAVYMVLFIGLSFAAHYFADWLSLQHGDLALSGLAALGSLAALVWPVLRGIPWRQVRQDIGWQAGRQPWLEPFLGIGCYAMALPLLFAGAMMMFGLMKLRDRLGFGPEEFGPIGAPGHPIVFEAARAGWWVWLEVLFVAGVVAPIVEETMFRGVLYRHLREASSALRPALSVLFSALIVSFVFAVIHPQGWLGVPVLMALALAFTLMREWRGTLLPPMIAHGVNNALATLMMFFAMS